jgi:hypothetical protein
MERSAWTGERLDDFAATVRRELGLVRTEMRDGFRDLRAEIGGVRAEMIALRADFVAMQRQLIQIVWGFAIAMLGAVVALIVTVV